MLAGPWQQQQPQLRGACAAELLLEVEESISEGRDDERLAVAALAHASERRFDPGFAASPAELDALLLGLERLVRRNLVAFTPDQLGAAVRWVGGGRRRLGGSRRGRADGEGLGVAHTLVPAGKGLPCAPAQLAAGHECQSSQPAMALLPG
jgi:hypothetical protein